MSNEFIFWDRHFPLDEEDTDIFNIILQFDFGDGNMEYSLEQLKRSGTDYSRAAGALKYIICVYRENTKEYLAFVDIDDGTIGYTFILKGEEDPCEFEGQDIVAANIFGITDDVLYENLN